MYQAKSGVKFFSLYWGGSPPPTPTPHPGKVAQNELKQILVLEFLRSDDFWGGGRGPSVRYRWTYNRTDTRHSDQISRSARRDGATKNTIDFSDKYLVNFMWLKMYFLVDYCKV